MNFIQHHLPSAIIRWTISINLSASLRPFTTLTFTCLNASRWICASCILDNTPRSSLSSMKRIVPPGRIRIRSGTPALPGEVNLYQRHPTFLTWSPMYFSMLDSRCNFHLLLRWNNGTNYTPSSIYACVLRVLRVYMAFFLYLLLYR